jgi:hypothetical protein
MDMNLYMYIKIWTCKEIKCIKLTYLYSRKITIAVYGDVVAKIYVYSFTYIDIFDKYASIRILPSCSIFYHRVSYWCIYFLHIRKITIAVYGDVVENVCMYIHLHTWIFLINIQVYVYYLLYGSIFDHRVSYWCIYFLHIRKITIAVYGGVVAGTHI